MSGNVAASGWYLARDGKKHGPITEAELRRLVDDRHLKPEDLLWRAGMAGWQAAGELPEVGASEPGPPASAR